MNNCINAQDTNKDICEYIGCGSDAVDNIAIKVGNKKISLSLCNSCKQKFREATSR